MSRKCVACSAAVLVAIALAIVVVVGRFVHDATKPVPGWTSTPSPSITQTR